MQVSCQNGIKNTTINVGKDVGGKELSYNAVGNVN
jgi:hypothetical protein